MSNSEYWKEQLTDLFADQKLAVLATMGEEGPYTNLVAFIVSLDLKSIIFATTRKSTKFNNLSACPNVSFLMDNRGKGEVDFEEAMAVTALGKVVPLSEDETIELRKFYLAKHGCLDSFINSPTCEIVKVNVDRYLIVNRFQSVTELRV